MNKTISRVISITLIKKIFIILFIVGIIITAGGTTADAASIGNTAKSAVLMEVNTGRVLFEKNAHQKLPMASTTKIMTCIIVLETCDLEEIISVDPAASGIEGSSIWLSPNENITVKDLLYGLMLSSGNDAAEALAIHVAGSLEEFAALMNKKAREIGASNSNFVNPHGLPDSNHYTTAYYLALISSYGMQNAKFTDIVSTQYKNISWEGSDWDRSLKNKNKILWDYEGANGIKTGYTDAAGRCVATAAMREEMQLSCVVLNDSDMFGDSMKILDYGFENYSVKPIIEKGEYYGSVIVNNGTIKSCDVYADSDVSFPLKKGEENKITTRIILDDSIDAPVIKGQTLGEIECLIDNKVVASSMLKAERSVEENTMEYNIFKIITDWINSTIYSD